MYGPQDEVRLYPESPSSLGEEPYRSNFRRDYARVIHSHAFRRLQGKQQLYPGLESDFFRSRLTHSLEVAQISKSIGIRLNNTSEVLKNNGVKLDIDILEFAGISHDIGHPPFGHKGERALNNLMKGNGGFEGNAQTIRVLSRLEKKIKNENQKVGLNLTARSLASILKYDNEIPLGEKNEGEKENKEEKVAKGYYQADSELVNWAKSSVLGSTFLPSNFKTIECSIMDLADDIAYSVFDFEDGLKAGFYTFFDFIYSQERRETDNIFKIVAEKLIKKGLTGISEAGVHKTMSDLIYSLFTAIPDRILELQPKTEERIKQIKFTNAYYYKLNLAFAQDGILRTQASSYLVGKFIRDIEINYNDKYPQLSTVTLAQDTYLQVETLKQFVYEFIVSSPRILISEIRGYDIVKEIFENICNEPRLLPKDNYKLYYKTTDEGVRRRIICDFVSGMTDRYAIEFYGRLKSMDPVTIFKQY